MNRATSLCQPSVLRQHRKSGRVGNTDHTAWGGASAPAETPPVPAKCWRGLLDRRAEVPHALRPGQLGFVGLESADSILHCVVDDVLHL